MGGPAAFRGALLLLLLGVNRGGVRAFAPPAAKTTSYARVVSSTSTLKMAPDAAGKRAAATKLAKGLARRALKTLPTAVVAAAGAAAFPGPAAAFTAQDYLTHALTKRNLAGACVVAATCAQVVRVARNPPGAAEVLGATVGAAEVVTTEANGAKKPGKVPITVLSGFLGAGKTTALKRLLENTEGIKVGTIVNDMASVNIDAKLISNPMSGGGANSNVVGKGSTSGTVELQNGCACCSLSDELLTSISDLMKGRELDAIVVELSGVADPAAVKQNWEQAVRNKHPCTESAELGRIVTVPELLAEQVEAADTLILNKIDLSKGEQLNTAKLVVRNLNKDAELIETAFGEMTPDKIIGNAFGTPVQLEDAGHSHSHDHGASCSDPDCTDVSHSHAHEHGEASCSEPECTDTSHSHSHSHSSEACSDPDCSDTSHSHSHDHTATTSTDNLGISSFVYKSSRPFDARKLQRLLLTWPIPVMEELNLVELEKELEKADEEESAQSPFVGVLRSKGFAWVAPSIMSGPFNDLERHDMAMYWSHAGKHFGLKEAGSWWASMGKEAMKTVFESNMAEYERIIREDFVSGEWGDRRQEIVFIGANIDEQGIRDALDDCLCTDEQIAEYKQGILDAIQEYMEAQPSA
ncbi:hypothetical protein ACHAXT_004543 [Thalassiosira profunda]